MARSALLSTIMTHSRDNRRPLVIMSVLCVLLTCVSVYVSLRVYPHRPESSDFFSFYEAGRVILSGQGHNLYPNTFGYIHPPFEAPLFAPFAGMSLLHGYLGWAVLNLMLLAAVPFVLRPVVPLLARRPYLALCGFCFFPALNCVAQAGQDSVLVLLAACVAYRLMVGGKPFTSGLVLGLGAVKPHFVLLLFIMLLACRKWKMSGGIAACSTALAAASLAVIGARQVGAYVAFLDYMARRQNLTRMVNALGFLYGVGASHVFGTSLVISAAIFLAGLVFAARAFSKGRLDLGFAIAITTCLFASPYVHFADMPVLLLPILLVAETGWLLLPNLVLFFAPLALRLVAGAEWWSKCYLMFPVGVFFLLCLMVRVGGAGGERVLAQAVSHEGLA